MQVARSINSRDEENQTDLKCNSKGELTKKKRLLRRQGGYVCKRHHDLFRYWRFVALQFESERESEMWTFSFFQFFFLMSSPFFNKIRK